VTEITNEHEDPRQNPARDLAISHFSLGDRSQASSPVVAEQGACHQAKGFRAHQNRKLEHYFRNPLFASAIKSKITANPASDGRSASTSIGNSSMQVRETPERRFDFFDPDFGSTK
jgi:hypothetical protein